MTPSLQQRIEAIFNEWRPILGLEGWNIIRRFDERKLKGYCIGDPKYLTAELGFNLPRIREVLRKARKEVHEFEPLEELVLHEMVHIIHPRSNETSISQTAFALLRARYVER